MKYQVLFSEKKKKNTHTRIPRNAVSQMPALCHKIEVNLKSLSYIRNKR